jgi:hypothetical protein
MLFSLLLLVSSARLSIAVLPFCITTIFIATIFLRDFTIHGAKEKYCAELVRKEYTPTTKIHITDGWWQAFTDCEQSFTVKDFIITIAQDLVDKLELLSSSRLQAL